MATTSTYTWVSTDSVLRDPTAPPFSTQTGIASNCKWWMRASKGDTCYGIAGSAGIEPSALYQLNPFLGANGKECDMQFWANYWYCVATGALVATTETGKPLTVTTTSPAATKTDSPTATTKAADGAAPTTTKPNTAAATTTTTAAPGGAASDAKKYLGCASEVPGRLLNQASTTANDMTIEKCLSFCSTSDLPLAGLEYGRECFCGIALSPSVSLKENGCTMPCAGGKGQVCGGTNRVSVYQNMSVSVLAIPPTVSGYGFLGCFDESAGRVLGATMTGDDRLTVDRCVGFCVGKGYDYAGVEYGRECWCAKSLRQNAAKLDIDRCEMRCLGNGSQFCGGRSALAVYSKGSEKRDVDEGYEAPAVRPAPEGTEVNDGGPRMMVKTIQIVRRELGDDEMHDAPAPAMTTPVPEVVEVNDDAPRTIIRTIQMVRREREAGGSHDAPTPAPAPVTTSAPEAVEINVDEPRTVVRTLQMVSRGGEVDESQDAPAPIPAMTPAPEVVEVDYQPRIMVKTIRMVKRGRWGKRQKRHF